MSRYDYVMPANIKRWPLSIPNEMCEMCALSQCGMFLVSRADHVFCADAGVASACGERLLSRRTRVSTRAASAATTRHRARTVAESRMASTLSTGAVTASTQTAQSGIKVGHHGACDVTANTADESVKLLCTRMLNEPVVCDSGCDVSITGFTVSRVWSGASVDVGVTGQFENVLAYPEQCSLLASDGGDLITMVSQQHTSSKSRQFFCFVVDDGTWRSIQPLYLTHVV